MKKNFFPSAIDAGIISGFIFIGLQMLLVTIFEFGKFRGSSSPTTIFEAVIFGYFIHFILIILFTCIIGFIVLRMNLRISLIVGLVISLALYFVNSFLFTNVFPWFSKTMMWVSVLTHLVYGLVAVWCFKSFYETSSATASLSQ